MPIDAPRVAMPGKFGRLTPVQYVGPRGVWSFVCDCGKECRYSGADVRLGRIKSCGCGRIENGKKYVHRVAGKNKRDLSGQRFGRLVAIRLAPSGQNTKWYCICDCGEETQVALTSLTNGGTTSCGCFHREIVSALGKRHALPELGSLAGKERRRQWAKNHYRDNAKHRAAVKVHAASRRAAQSGADRLTAKEWLIIEECCGGRCAYCGGDCDNLTMDHMVPLSRGGQHVWTNVIGACRSCNTKKHARPLGEALEFMGTDRDRFWGIIMKIEERLGTA